MSEYNFTQDAMEDYLYWQRKDRKVLDKINKLLKEISRTPFYGSGKPEALKNEDGKWSRRINDKDRLVYSYENDRVTIYQCKGHYGDK